MLAFLLAAAMSSTPLPSADVDTNCLRYGETNKGLAGPDAVKRYREECVKSEQRQYDYLKDVWDTLSETEKIKCLRQKPVSPYLVYTGLGYCALSFATINDQIRQKNAPVTVFRR